MIFLVRTSKRVIRQSNGGGVIFVSPFAVSSVLAGGISTLRAWLKEAKAAAASLGQTLAISDVRDLGRRLAEVTNERIVRIEANDPREILIRWFELTNRGAVFLPFYGEFGCKVLDHFRYVNSHPAKRKIVCCEKGEECLYPCATRFVFNWRNPLRDFERCGTNLGGNRERVEQYDRQLRIQLHEIYPHCALVRPCEYDRSWNAGNSAAFKFHPLAPPLLPTVDIALGVRRRLFFPERNFPYWKKLAADLQSRGFSIGLAGAKKTSFDLTCAEARAWDHADGETAGTVDLLRNCRLYIGTDTGVSHLAALIDTPSIIFRQKSGPDLTDLMRRASTAYFRRLPDCAWVNPGIILEAAASYLSGCQTDAPAEAPLDIATALATAYPISHHA